MFTGERMPDKAHKYTLLNGVYTFYPRSAKEPTYTLCMKRSELGIEYMCPKVAMKEILHFITR